MCNIRRNNQMKQSSLSSYVEQGALLSFEERVLSDKSYRKLKTTENIFLICATIFTGTFFPLLGRKVL